MASFLDGAVTMACLAIGAFFAKYWRDSLDRLFLCLAVAFGIFAINYAVLGLLPLADERLAFAFVLRLVGFVAILIGLLMKGRELAPYVETANRESRH
ncbi:MAG TPA: DUF5985 family protein [Vicinamibacterales bacterium]|jgi:hypothetical protein|nr:DUF5985 family protein [Vicinamibacterales bacterium]